MASGESLRLRQIQPTGPVQVAEEALPKGQHQPGPGPYRAAMRAKGQRSDRARAKGLRHVPQVPHPSGYALERHQRRMERRSRSVGLVMVKPPGWGAKHTRRLAEQDAASRPRPPVLPPFVPSIDVRLPTRPATAAELRLKYHGSHATPRQRALIRHRANRERGHD
jgi:hypothetical protein